ncbi:hypothetical protein KSF_063230 [Reticulibacter mediterranei]|uniref:site-specific DNA-methyltransferase (adenine-specific) n=1 Tax=Reticulibacter mediterranei TaxID=2778369 RepID=A0A8J3IPT8_9CHLR|nr:N-6 DNA methylase [Reticulibacter mediterranei]GHO96275.1 hypothetical protein KSF_063230 [Reticulibacter mediterranei]
MGTIDEEIQKILNEIWLMFNRSSIVDNREIIEYIALLLLEIAGKKLLLLADFIPRRPRKPYNGQEEEIKEKLVEASRLAQGEGNLFDRYVLFHAFDSAQKESYPIPRHIERFMLNVLEIASEDTFADFTCGSGGFLVNRYVTNNTHTGTSVGIDISPEWVRIAAANVVLHNLSTETVQLYNGDAFILCHRNFAGTEFDRIAMAPPFGITIDERTARETMNVTNGRASELLFTSLALNKLKEGGRAIIMVPESLLTDKKSTMKLKRTILEKHTMRAVVLLGEGALYPFNHKNVGLLLLERDRQQTVHPWLFNVENDGYTRRRNRNITAEAASGNDLETITEVLRLREPDFWPIPRNDGNPDTTLFSVFPLHSTEQPSKVHFVIKVMEQAILTSIWRIEENKEGSENRHYFFAKASIPGQAVQYIALPLDKVDIQPTDIEHGEDDIAWLKTLDEKRTGVILFASNTPGQTVAILADGRLLGCTRTVEAIQTGNYNIRPVDYFNDLVQRQVLSDAQLQKTQQPTSQRVQPEVDESGVETRSDIAESLGEEGSALDSLNTIKRLHNQIRQRADYLLGQLETRPFVDLPPRVCDLSSLTLPHHLGNQQDTIWKAIKQFVDPEGHALYFTQYQLLQKLEEKDVVKVQHTLEILTRMGVLVHVHINHSDKGVVNCYRLPTEHDQVSLGESLSSKEERI